MEFPEGTGAFTVLRRAAGTEGKERGPCGESLPNQGEIRAAAV